MTTDRIDTFGTQAARETTLASLQQIFSLLGVHKLYVKRLAHNDNSKNQIYLGGDFSALNIVPVSAFEAFQSSSTKDSPGSGKLLIRGALKFYWIDHSGLIYPAPNAKLILYPQYPEVRLSGYLQGSDVNASEWMDPYKKGRSEGRFLLLGIHPDGSCYAHLSVPGSAISKELDSVIGNGEKVLNEVPVGPAIGQASKARLLSELGRIHLASPIAGKKFDKKTGVSKPYKAANGGGYTLEAELGIAPNGHAEPDFEGWEVKAYSGTVVTLMTPEPDGGIYQDSGVEAFVRRYGYADRKGREDRMNFGGIHKVGTQCTLTGLKMSILGFSAGSKSIEPEGRICLVDEKDNVAAEWTFTKLLGHWNKKHAQAAYIPYEKVDLYGSTGYFYEDEIFLGEGTDFIRLLEAFSANAVFYDPGIKLVAASTNNPTIKRRSQFRIRANALGSLYEAWELVSLN